jgi:hypothetical protein
MQSVFNIDRGEHKVVMYMPQGFLTFEARNLSVDFAKKNKFDAILWVDSDMVIPSDALLKLISHTDKHEVITGIYYRREQPCWPMIFMTDGKEYRYIPMLPEGLIEVGGIGFGCVLTMISAFDGMEQPFGFRKVQNVYETEDLYFCDQYNKLGKKIAADTTVKCGHITSKIITDKDWYNFKQPCVIK